LDVKKSEGRGEWIKKSLISDFEEGVCSGGMRWHLIRKLKIYGYRTADKSLGRDVVNDRIRHFAISFLLK
jgi:hypothetical protein